jgi:hypothetical protein
VNEKATVENINTVKRIRKTRVQMRRMKRLTKRRRAIKRR